jgi:hypothetical protein
MADEHVVKCATAVRETVYLVVRAVAEERSCRPPSWLTPAAIAALKAIQEGNVESQSDEVLEALVASGYAQPTRLFPGDRGFALTDEGERVVETEEAEELAYLAQLLSLRSATECDMMALAMDMVRSVFDEGVWTCFGCHGAQGTDTPYKECRDCGCLFCEECAQGHVCTAPAPSP